MGKKHFFAVAKGARIGIFRTWEETQPLVNGFSGAKYRGFSNNELAVEWMGQMGLELRRDGRWAALDESGGFHPAGDHGRYSGGPATQVAAINDDRDRGRKRVHNDVSAVVAGIAGALPSPVLVYTDGSSLGNGKHGARAGFGVFYGPPFNHFNVARPVPRDEEQTNNRGELHAILCAVQDSLHGRGPAASPLTPLVVRTDSEYSIKCVFEWSRKWKTNGWKTSNGQHVKNRDLIELLEKCIHRRRSAFHDALMATIAAAVQAEAGTSSGGADDEDDDVMGRSSRRRMEHRQSDPLAVANPVELDAESRALVEVAVSAAVGIEWVRGHAGQAGNEAANELAMAGARQ